MRIADTEGTLDLEEFLRRPLFAHLATYDGTKACESPVWFLWEEGFIWIIGSITSDKFPTRIQSLPECAIGITDLNTRTGLVNHVGFRGRAEIVGWDVERAKRKLRRYLGGDESRWDRNRFSLKADSKNLIFVKFTPETAVVRDQSYAVIED